MINTLESLTEPLIRIRLELLYTELLECHKEYTQLSSETYQYFKTLRDALPDQLQHTVFLYEDAQISLQSILERSIYIQGFKDALQLFSELKILVFRGSYDPLFLLFLILSYNVLVFMTQRMLGVRRLPERGRMSDA